MGGGTNGIRRAFPHSPGVSTSSRRPGLRRLLSEVPKPRGHRPPQAGTEHQPGTQPGALLARWVTLAKTLTPRLSSSRHLRFFLSLTGALKSRLTEPWGSEALTERRLSKSREATERGLCPVHLLGGHERVCCVCSRASGRPVCLLLVRWFAECARPLCCHWTLGDRGRIRRPARKGAVGRTGLERGASGGWDGV